MSDTVNQHYPPGNQEKDKELECSRRAGGGKGVPLKIHYCKYDATEYKEDQESQQTKPRMINLEYLASSSPKDRPCPFQIENLQLYNPIYREFFDMTEKKAGKLALNHPYHMQTMTKIFDIQNSKFLEKDVHIKFSPLLDPVRYMIGKYDTRDKRILTMPTLLSKETDVFPKLLSYNNTSYIDCFFSYLTSALLHHRGFLHGVDFYGSYLGVQSKFRVCITDDLDYVRGYDFFNENIGKLFYIDDSSAGYRSEDDEFSKIARSHKNKQRLDLNISDKTIVLELEELDELGELEGEEDLDKTSEEQLEEPVYQKTSGSNNSSDKSSNDSELNYSSGGEESGSEGSEEGDQEEGDQDESEDSEEWESASESYEEEEEIYGYINNFPVQMICLEKCSGTLDELFVKHQIDENTGASALFQVIVSIYVYQKMYKFTHNDLHTNNIMWINTELEYLTYKIAGKTYLVPTYGKIFKLIDFGRAIYKFQEKQFCSDGFSSGGDAATQYNFEPFFNSNKPRLEPNYSFDLSRLGTSIFDFLMDENTPVSKMNELQKTIRRWCMDDNGKNVLYKKTGEERYPGFKLYKMIARTVHQHTPENQFNYTFFSQFEADLKTNDILMNIDEY